MPESTETQCTATSELPSWLSSGPMRGGRFPETATTMSVALGAVDQLVESIDAAQDGDRIGLGMERQMTAARPEARGSAMTGIDEPDDRQPAPGLLTEVADRAAEHRAWHPAARPGFAPGIAGLATMSSRSSMNRRRSLGDDTAPGPA